MDNPQRTPPFPAAIHALTSLRYFAAVWVVLFHFRVYFPRAYGLDTPLLTFGYLGVDFFFVLSGFVLAHVYLGRLQGGSLDFWDFVAKRVARIYPLHVATLVAMIAFGVISKVMHPAFFVWDPAAFMGDDLGATKRGIFAHLTMTHAWGSTQGLMFNLPSWSISAEWFAYLTFPLLGAAALFFGRRVWLGVAAVLCLVALMSVAARLTGPSLVKMSWNIGALRIIPEFLLGLMIYRLGQQVSFGSRGARIGFAVSLAAMIGFLLAGLPAELLVPPMAGVILCAADAERHGGLRILAHPFPVLLGEISYSVYMLHFGMGVLMLDIVAAPWRHVGTGTAVLAITVAVAVVTFCSWLSHAFFETRARTWITGAARRIGRGGIAEVS